MSEIEDIADMKFDEQLRQVDLSELDVVDLRINEQLDTSEELLGLALDPADDTLSTLGMPWEVSRTVFRSWMLPLLEITLIYCVHQLFPYPNFSLIQTNF